AVDGDGEEACPPRRVVAVGEQHAVLDGDRRKLARADAEERQGPVRERFLLDRQVRPGAPEPEARRGEEGPPRARPRGIAETGVVATASEAVGARVLRLGPAGWKIVRGLDLVVDNRVLADGGTDDRVVAPQCGDEAVETGDVEDAGHRLQRCWTA